MSDIKSNKLELVDEDGTTETLSDVELTLKNVGIDLRKTVTEYNSYEEVLDSLAAKWDTLNQVQQNALTKAFAGTRQGENFRVLMENYDKAVEYSNVAADSLGTAEEKFDAYLDSIEAKTKSLQASFESLANNTISTNMIGGIIDTTSAIINLIDKSQILKGTLTGLAVAGTIKTFSTLSAYIFKAAAQMSDFNTALSILKTGAVSNTSGLSQLITLTNNLSASQLKVVLSSQSLSTAQKMAILTSRGLTQEEAKAVLTSLGLTTAQNGAAASTRTLSSAFKGLWATLQANPLILVATAITAVVSVYSALKQKAEEARQAALDAGEAAKTEAQNITDLYQAYSEAKTAYDANTGSKESLEEATDSLLSALGYEKSAIDDLIEKYGSLDKAIRNVTLDTIAEKRTELTQGYEAAKEQLLEDAKTGLIDSFLHDYMFTLSLGKGDEADMMESILSNANIAYGGGFGSFKINGDLLIGDLTTVEGVQETYEYLLNAREALEAEIGNLYTREELSETTVYKEISNKLNTLKSSYEGLEDYISNINSLTAFEEISKGLNNSGIPETQEEFDSLRESIIKAAKSNGEFVGTQEDIENAIDNTLAEFPELESFAENYADTVENISGKSVDVSFSDTITQLDGLTKGLSAISTAYSNIQENGKLDFDDVSSITENLSDVEGLGTYIENIQNAVGNAEQLDIAVSDLTNAYIEQSGVLDNLNESNASLITSFLEEQGVTNATAVVQNQLALNMADTAVKTGDFTDATWENIAAMLQECGALNNVNVSVSDLRTAYVTAQTAMSAAVQSGALARLGILQKELAGIQSIAEAYALLGGVRPNQTAANDGNYFGNYTSKNTLSSDEQAVLNAATAAAEYNSLIKNISIDVDVPSGGGGSSGGGGGSGSGSSSTPKTNDNYYNYFEAQIENYKKAIENYKDEIEKIDEKMEEALENNDYALYQELKAEKEQTSKEFQDYLAEASADVRSTAKEEVYPIIYKFAPELEGTTVDEWSKETILDIQKRVDDEIVDMENSGADTAEIEAARKEAEELMDTLETAYDLVGNENGEGDWAEAWAEEAKRGKEDFETEFDELLEYYDRKIQEITDQADSINNEISLIEAQGYEANDALTRKLIENKEQENEILEAELVQLEAKIAQGIAEGVLIEGSDTYLEMQREIADITSQIADNNIDIAGWTKDLDEVDRHVSIFEKTLSRISDVISKISSLASSSFKSFTSKKSYITQEITAIKNGISSVNSEMEYLQELINNSGLSDEIMTAIKNGTIDYLAIDDEEISKTAQDVNSWYERLLELQSDSIDYAEQLASAYQELFNNVSSKYESITNQLELNISLIEQAISMSETQGYLTSSSYYESLISLQEETLPQLEAQKSELESAFKTAVSSGGIEKGSEAWNEMQSSINDVTSAIWECQASILEYESTIRELDWSNFDYLQETISEITEEADFLIDLLSYSDLYDDSGNLTDEGTATLGLHGLNYNTYMEQAAKYAEELAEIEEELANDEYDTDLLERKQELLEAQRDSILAAEEEKEAIKDLVEEGIDAELKALQDLIDQYEDYLDEVEDLYEFQKDVADQTSDIASLRKQIAAYANDTSEETKAKLQQLNVQLEEAEEELAETQYKQYISDMKKLLSNLYDEYEEFLNSQLDDVETLIENVIAQVNSSSSDIKSTLETVSTSVGYTLSDEMETIWTPVVDETGEISDVLTTYSNNMVSSMTTLQTTVEGIVDKIEEMIEASDDLAASLISAASSDSTAVNTGSGSTSSSSSDSSNVTVTTDDSASKDTSSSSSDSSSSSSSKMTDSQALKALAALASGKGDYLDTIYDYKNVGQQAALAQSGTSGKRTYFVWKQPNTGEYIAYYVTPGDTITYGKTVLGTYATGTKYNPKAGEYLVDEEGAELIAHNSGGRITGLEVGDRVFNSGETANLADNLEAMASSEWVRLEDTDFYKRYMNSIVSGLPYTTPMYNIPYTSEIVPNYSSMATTNSSSVNYNYYVDDISLPNVQNASELYGEIMNIAKKDNKFTKLVQTVTASGLDSRKNSKAKNNIQF